MYGNRKRLMLYALFASLFILPGCTSYVYTKSQFPAATAKNPHLLSNVPVVDLGRYQSIEDDHRRPWQRSDIAIAVAASGGGYRAANVTAGFMLAMQNFHDPHLRGSLLDEVDYYSTVSGSGFAVGAYISGLYDYLVTHPNTKSLGDFDYQKIIAATKDSVTGVRNHGPLSTPFTDQLFWAYLLGKAARGSQFQDEIDMEVLGKKRRGRSLQYGDVFVERGNTQREAKMPYWIPNATGFQNLQRVPLTPDVMAEYQLYAYEHNHRYIPIAGPMSRPDYAFDVPLALGLRTSSNYPFALPPTVFLSQGCEGGGCYLQLIDGGLADNTGILTALDVLYQDKAPIKILIVIDAFSGNIQPFSQRESEPGMLPMLAHIYEAVGDSRNEIKSRLHGVAKAVLCRQQTQNVLVLYYDLDKDTQARMVGTKLDITEQEQLYLLHTGRQLFDGNAVALERLMTLLKNGVNDRYSHC